jgi:hypothetical protein
VGALYDTAADIQRRAHPLIGSHRLCSHSSANDIHHGVHGPNFVKMNGIDISIVNLGLGHTQGIKNGGGCRLRRVAKGRAGYDLLDLAQAATGTGIVRVFLRAMMLVFVPRRLNPDLGRCVVVSVWVLFPINFPRQFFLSADQNVHLGSRNPAPVYPGDLQTSAYVQGCHCAFKNLRRHTAIQQRAQEHVAANAGEAV